MIYKMDLKDSSGTMTFNLLETPIVDKDIEGAVDNVTLDGNQYTDYLYLKKQYIQKWAIMCPDEYDELRGFYTRQFEDGEVPSYRVYYGANVTRDYTFNGDYFQFNAEGIETAMTLSQLLGNAEQTGTPTPDSPQPISTVTGEQNIEVVGKNLLNIDFTSTTTTGITITNNGDGTVTVSGTTTGAVGFNLSPSATNQQNPLTLAPNTAYTQRLEILSGSASNFSVVPAFKDSGGTVRYNFFQNNQTTTTTDTMTCTYYNIYWGSAGRVINATFRVWLEKGSDLASPYEPYHGQSYEVNLGKNLLDNKATTRTYLGVTLTKNNDGSITLNGTSTGNAQFYLDVDGAGFQGRNSHLGAGTYTLNGRDSGGVKFEINYQTANGSSKYSWGTFTVSEPFDYGVYVNVTNGTTVNNLRIYPQLERGSQATSYAPYFTPIELAKIGTYQDRIYKSDGKWYIEKRTGKLNMADITGWSNRSAGDLYLLDFPATYNAVIGECVSNIFTYSATTWTGAGKFGIAPSGSLWVMTGDSSVNSTNAPSWLANKNAIMYYALATPTTTEITNETLLLQLNFLASLYKGANNISLVGTGAQGEMEVFIRDVMSVETDVVPEVPVRLTLTDDGVINACGCRRNVQLTMRETTE